MNRELMVVIVLAIVMIVTAMQAFQLYGLVNMAKGAASSQLDAPAAVGQNPLPAASPKSAGGGAGMVGGC